jgi:curved DNA-binding protein CbpA
VIVTSRDGPSCGLKRRSYCLDILALLPFISGMEASTNFYVFIGVRQDCDFKGLKRAYYKRAKECHPDRFNGNPAKEAEFKELVHAFDVLSDPKRRQRYNEALELTQACAGMDKPVTMEERSFYSRSGRSVLDTLADDILEEIIVGNTVPRNTTLQNLMRDLENTERFLRFREAKNYYYNRDFKRAIKLFMKCAEQSPSNILYHYYAAQSAVMLNQHSVARRHYGICIKIGDSRMPPLRLERIRNKLFHLRKKSGIVGKVMNLLAPVDSNYTRPADQDMIDETTRVMANLIVDKGRAEQKKKLGSSKKRLMIDD